MKTVTTTDCVNLAERILIFCSDGDLDKPANEKLILIACVMIIVSLFEEKLDVFNFEIPNKLRIKGNSEKKVVTIEWWENHD